MENIGESLIVVVQLLTLLLKLNRHRKLLYKKERELINSTRKKNTMVLAKILRTRRRRMFQRSCWIAPELKLSTHGKYWEFTVPLYTEERFLMKLRMSRELFEIICNDLSPYIKKKDTRYRKAIPVDKRVAISLTVLKGNVDFGTVSDLYGVGKSTVGYILQEFCDAVISHYESLIKFPCTEEERSKIAEGFFSKWQFYDCFGAMDGTHIPILPPMSQAVEYYNYKSFHSVNVLAVTDDKYRFIYTSIGAPGRCNDASVLRRSNLFDMFDNNQKVPNTSTKYHIIADAAFPLQTWIMKPFTVTVDMPLMQKNFNYRLSSARMTIENAFGRLKARWRILSRRPDVHLNSMRKIIKTCIILHNLCENFNQEVCDNWIVKMLEEERIFLENIIQENDSAEIDEPQEDSVPAKTKRFQLAEKLYNDGISICPVNNS